MSILIAHNVTFADMPPDFGKRLHDLDAQYDHTVFLRDKLDTNKQREALAAILEYQKNLRRQRERLIEKLRGEIPNIAAWQYPQPLAVAQIRPILEPGTLMLSYMVGPNTTYLFALSRDEQIAVHEIDIDEGTLREQIARFSDQLQQATESKTGESTSRMASWLYTKLLGDVSEQITESERLLILPGGPLFYIPFAALIGPDGKYLAESKAVHSVVSATVYDQLQKRWSDSVEKPTQLTAFGNPFYPKAQDRKADEEKSKVELANAQEPESEGTANAIVSRAVERKLFDGGLTPLPHTEREVQAIGNLYGVEPFIGVRATEEKAKAVAEGIDILHIAAHGVADPITPLDSFIALSVTDNPERENGLLQAWEIYERVRLDADLVVLSACQTALGPETDGEGLISLTRAFQVAGARTVIASLWNVNDESTAELMIRFYKHLRGDEDTPAKTKDEALRAAQMEFIRGLVTFTDTNGKVVTRDFSSPYYWAAFQVIGDWK